MTIRFGQSIACWKVTQVDRFSMEVTFEQVEQRLSQLPRMFFEMDGSFVWRGQSHEASQPTSDWQVDGMVYDVNGRVSRVELKGRCAAKEFLQIALALQPAENLLAYCIDDGCFVGVDELMRLWN